MEDLQLQPYSQEQNLGMDTSWTEVNDLNSTARL